MDIIGISGSYSSGKDTAADYLVEKYGFEHHSLSNEIRIVLRERSEEPSRDNMMRVGNELRAEHGSGVLAERTLKRIKTEKVLVSSIRNLGEIEVLKKRAIQTNGRFALLWIDAPVEKRYELAKERGRIENVGSVMEFIEKENLERSTQEHKQQLGLCEKEANFKIMNDASKNDLYEKLDEVMSKVFGSKKNGEKGGNEKG